MVGKKLTVEEIRSLAIKSGYGIWKNFIKDGQEPLLDECLNYKRAWMFFRNPDIEIPDHASLKKCALVISSYGEVRSTADFYPDMNKCREYLQVMSEHFKEKGL